MHIYANSNDAHRLIYNAISDSIASISFTTLAVRFSLQFSVIKISSSIRIPIPQYFAGTSALVVIYKLGSTVSTIPTSRI